MTKKEVREVSSQAYKLFCKNEQLGKESLCSEFEDTLDLTKKDLSIVLNKLFKQKKLEHYGNKIFPYKRGFRFPEEIRFILRKLFRGNINGEAYPIADVLVVALESAIDKSNLDILKQPERLWGNNFPSVSLETAKYFAKHFGYLVRLHTAETSPDKISGKLNTRKKTNITHKIKKKKGVKKNAQNKKG